jgi:hypothetical protein
LVEKTNVGSHDASEWMNHTGMHTPPINCRADRAGCHDHTPSSWSGVAD